jgi:DNA-binding ferritin-like protein
MNFITNMLTLQNQLKVFHWQTQKKVGSYAQHVAFGTAYDELGEKIDDFIEIYQGKKGVLLGKDGFVIKLKNLSDNPESVIDSYVSYLSENVPQALEESDTDLLNLRDEMLAILNQTKYRLHMK